MTKVTHILSDMKESWAWARSKLFKCWEMCFQGAVQLNPLNTFLKFISFKRFKSLSNVPDYSPLYLSTSAAKSCFPPNSFADSL